MGGAIAMTAVIAVVLGVTAYLIGTMIRSIQNEKSTSMKLWKNFGLSLGFCALFLITWLAHGVTEWQHYTDQQREHKEPTEVGDFAAQFTQATLENWQSEFLQLFSFTVMGAVLIHKGSSESRDSEDRIEGALLRIERKLGTAPTLREPEGITESKDLHVVPDGFEGWALIREDSSEPEGYYDTQEQAIAGGRELAKKSGVALLIHGTDFKVRDESSK